MWLMVAYLLFCIPIGCIIAGVENGNGAMVIIGIGIGVFFIYQIAKSMYVGDKMPKTTKEWNKYSLERFKATYGLTPGIEAYKRATERVEEEFTMPGSKAREEVKRKEANWNGR